MLFNSPEYITLFLPITVGVWWWLQSESHPVAAQWMITIASLCFYAWWSLRFLPILIIAIYINYMIGRQLIRSPSVWSLYKGVVFNLGVLLFFKIAASVNTSGGLYVTDLSNTTSFGIPLGVSFFTVQAISFLVGCWKGSVSTINFGHFAFSTTFFPHLIAGPILRYSDVMPQLNSGQRFNPQTFSQGMFLFGLGLCKKSAIADRLAGVVDPLFAGNAQLQIAEAWTAVVGYSLQIYFDFSGYSDMALGAALLFGLSLPQNFRSPYQAASITDFWRRWHISLSIFLRDYLYIPLGGNRCGFIRGIAAVIVTMILGGLWHGIGWTYFVWGLWHGTLIAGHRLWQKFGIVLNRWVGVLLTYLAVTIGWVVFRAESLVQAYSLLKGMVGFNGFATPPIFAWACPGCQMSGSITGLEMLGLCGLLWLCLTCKNSQELVEELTPGYRSLATLSLLFFIGFWFPGEHGSFIYWQF